MPPILEKVQSDKRGFASKITPVSSGGMMRWAVSVEDILNGIYNGNLALRSELYTPASTLNISGGTITTSLDQHIVAAETGTSDDLDTIATANNKFVFLKARAGDTIAVRHNAGNIQIPGGNNVILVGSRGVLLVCDNAQWSVIASSAAKANMSAIVDPGSSNDSASGYAVGSIWLNVSLDRGWICTNATAGLARWRIITRWKNQWRLRSADVAVLAIGAAAPTVSTNHAAANANTATDTFVQLDTTAVSANSCGVITPTFDLVRLDFDPIIEILYNTDLTLGSSRLWVGLTTVDGNNSDTLTAGTKFIGFRHKNTTDTGWTPVMNDGTNQNNGTTIGSFSSNTTYKLRIRVISGSGAAYFSVNDGAEQLLNSNSPAASTGMGLVARLFTNESSIHVMKFGSARVSW